MDSFSATSACMPALRSSISEDPGRYRVLTGERPTGQLHLGHYVGPLRERVRLQDAGVETFVILADYQVITDRDTAGTVRENVYSAVLDYLAAGIDPARSTIFTHSAVPELHQLFLPFLSLVTEAELHRNPTVKSELLASGRALNGLLLTYPVHQAADILFCKGDLVPFGKDNLPHVEAARRVRSAGHRRRLLGAESPGHRRRARRQGQRGSQGTRHRRGERAPARARATTRVIGRGRRGRGAPLRQPGGTSDRDGHPRRDARCDGDAVLT